MTEQEKIDEAANKLYPLVPVEKDKFNFNQGMIDRRSGFDAGASFYAKEVMPGKVMEFGQWLWRNYRQIDAQVWKQRDSHSGTVYTMTELVNLFVEQSKQNQDAPH